MNTLYKGREYTAQEIAAMREWAADCEWGDLDQSEIKSLPAMQILKGIDRNIPGGVLEFVKNMM